MIYRIVNNIGNKSRCNMKRFSRSGDESQS